MQRWGEPRVTRDIDVTVFVGFGSETKWISLLLEHFDERIPDAAQFAKQNRVLLLLDDQKTPIDVALGGFSFERNMIKRASEWGTPQRGTITTCSAEDLVVLKAFADRPQDWIDVENVLIRQGDRMDRDLVIRELQPLVALKEEPEILSRLKSLFVKTA